MRKYAFLLLSVISACCSSSHGDVFSIPLRNGKYTNTPDFFVEGAGHLVRNYKKITGNYPAAWEQIKDVHDLRFDPVYNVIFSRKGSSVEIKDNVLLDYDSISRKECYRYIIFKNDEFVFLLKSENNAGVQDYITDGLETWFCYADPQTEQDVIKKCDGMVRSHSLFNSDERRTDAILQLSHIYDKRSFDVLFGVIENTNEDMSFRIETSYFLEAFYPKLNRFAGYNDRIKGIVLGLNKEDAMSTKFFGLLQKLFLKINNGAAMKPACVPDAAGWDMTLKRWRLFDYKAKVKYEYYIGGNKALYQEYVFSGKEKCYVPNGKTVTWNVLGQTETEGLYNNGCKDGLWYRYGGNGKPEILKFEKGSPVDD